MAVALADEAAAAGADDVDDDADDDAGELHAAASAAVASAASKAKLGLFVFVLPSNVGSFPVAGDGLFLTFERLPAV